MPLCFDRAFQNRTEQTVLEREDATGFTVDHADLATPFVRPHFHQQMTPQETALARYYLALTAAELRVGFVQTLERIHFQACRHARMHMHELVAKGVDFTKVNFGTGRKIALWIRGGGIDDKG